MITNFSSAKDEVMEALEVRAEYVPPHIRSYFLQAHETLRSSPSASSALSRMCIQAMIRDTCDVDEGALSSEISELLDDAEGNYVLERVSRRSLEAIEAAVQNPIISDIFSKASDCIYPCRLAEASTLVQLMDVLVDEWYLFDSEITLIA